LATAWPEDFESQSRPKPSQSPGFQAKPGRNITNLIHSEIKSYSLMLQQIDFKKMH
jgi:hypothetical protein